MSALRTLAKVGLEFRPLSSPNNTFSIFLCTEKVLEGSVIDENLESGYLGPTPGSRT